MIVVFVHIFLKADYLMRVMPMKQKRQEPSFVEFVVIISLMTSLTAMSIDMMLPALATIDQDLGLQNINDRQLIVSMLILGMGLGQMFFGPLSDSTGRKRSMVLGYALYIGGALLSVFALNFRIMLIGRFLQGVGVSAPRALGLAVVRDRYAGKTMARVMSFVMTVFILMPIVAPSFGQIVLLFAGWRAIFVTFIVMALVSITWFLVRMPETLDPANHAPFSVKRITGAAWAVVRNRTALGYTLSAGLVSGAFLGYLNSAQQIFQEQYALGELFPLVFSGIAIPLGAASLSNTRLVMRFGMSFLVNTALRAIVLLALVALAVSLFTMGNPPLWFLLAYLVLSFFCVGILFGNLNAMAMEPLGHMAGIGAAMVGALSTLLQMVLGTIIGQSYNNTVFPLVAGLAILGSVAIIVVKWTEAGEAEAVSQA